MKNKKILIFIGSLNIGGTEKQLVKILKYLYRFFDIQIFTIQEKGLLSIELESIGIKIVEPKYKKKKNKIFFYFCLILQILLHVFKFKPNIIHYYLPHSYLIAGVPLSIFFRIKKIMSRRSLNNYQKKYPLVRLIEILLHKQMNIVTSNCSAINKQLIEQEFVKKEKVLLIRNGVDIPVVKKKITKKKIVKILSIANFIPYKNHQFLIESLSLLSSKLNWELSLIGKDNFNYVQKYKNLSESLGIRSKIKFCGSQKNVTKYLNNSDIGVLTSNEEGCSNSILEYMSFSLPVLATNVGGNKDLVKHKHSGYLISKGDKKSFIDYLTELIENKNLRVKFGDKGLRIVKDKFSLKELQKNNMKLYEELLNK